jgi:hypothetical protein
MKKIAFVVAALLMATPVSADINVLVSAGSGPNDGSTIIDAGGKATADGYEPDNFPADATAIGDGETQSHTIHTDGDVDWLSVTVQTGKLLTVETSNLSGSNADTVLELYDSNCNPLTDDDDGGPGLGSRIGWTATYGGLHYVKVRTYGGSYAHCNDQGGGLADCYYDLTATVTAGCDNPDGYEPDNTPAGASLIGDGQTQSHTIHTTGDVDWLSVALQRGDELTVETSNLYGTNADTVLELYDSNCIMLTLDDDGGGGLASWLRWAATYSGLHYIKVWTYGGSDGYCNSGGGGPADCCYDVSVTVEPCIEPDPPNDPSPFNEADCAQIDTVLSWNGGAPAKNRQLLQPKLIYGADDRLDEYQVSGPALLAAGDATAAVLWRSNLTDNGDGTFSLETETFAEYYLRTRGVSLCPDEPFRDQPNAAWCSAFLVAPDTIATAGHCVTDAADCTDVAFVFGFVMLDANTPVLTIDASQVYYCSEIIDRELLASGADWALIRLDRQVTDHTPLAVRRSGTVPTGENLLMIGHPVGLPRKYAGGATVQDNSPAACFQANVDAYGGNSGSTVLNTNTLEVEGILVRGNEDFVYDAPNDCDRSNWCPDSGCPDWEDVTRATAFSHLIPSYDVYFGTDPCEPNLICQDVAVTWCNPGPIEAGTTYYWQVVFKTRCGQAEGPIWSFTTQADPQTCWSCLECAGQPSGDATCDGNVNLADLFALKANFGKCAPWVDSECCADFTQNGCINLADLFALKAGFGTVGYVPSTGNQKCP